MADKPALHKYHAEATALKGTLVMPFPTPIERQAYAKIETTEPKYLSQHAESFRTEGIVSYSEAHTQVSGHQEDKHDNPFVTLSTSVVEDLNILNVVTADRVIGQVSTEHPRAGYVPTVTFLGSQFVNLRIAGHPVEVELDWDILKDYPGGKAPITKHEGFLECLKQRLGIIRNHPNAPQDIKDRYKENGDPVEGGGEMTEFSLVKATNYPFPDKIFGHVIDIPHFGRVYLAVVTIKHEDEGDGAYRKTTVELKMVEAVMGCLAKGTVTASAAKTNGGTTPGGG